MSNFLIKTPGRTGSHIFTDYLRKNHYNNVKHCQEMWVPDNTENWIFILSKRRNWFDMACSRVITSHTKQYGPYKITEKLQVNTDIESLVDSAGYAKNWYTTFETQSKKYTWKAVYTIYYEDLKTDKSILQSLDNCIQDYDFDKTMISPYIFKETIIDYENLKTQFLEWQQDVNLNDE
jgi:hypothetical protein|tara:strand:- start:1547 stop:2080 length:534 start_codon:yes stop_codon:yes gene_type:complete